MSTSRDERADAYLHGLLSPGEAREFERDLDADDALRAALETARRRRSLLESALPPAEASESLVRAALKQIEDHIRRRRRLRRLIYAGLFAPVAACAFIVALLHSHYGTLSATPANLEVFGQETLLPGSAGALRVRLTDRTTLGPMPGVPVEITLGEPGSESFVSLATVTTDQLGNGQPSFRLPDWADGRYDLRVTARTPGKPEVITRTVNLKRSTKLMLTSDKPRYQPGQTIHIRSLTLSLPDLKPAAGAPAVFSIRDPRGNVIYSRIEQTSRFGIAAIDCPLASELIEGEYRIQCRVGDTESTLLVMVEKYILPKVRLVIDTSMAWYRPGQEMRGTLTATYLHGEPAADARWEIEFAAATIGEPRLTKLTGRTDSNGKAAFSLRVPPNLEGSVSLIARLTDRAGQQQTTRALRRIDAAPFRYEIIPESGVLVAGIPNIVYLYAHTPDDAPAKVQGAVTIDGVAHAVTTGELGMASFTFTPPAGTFLMSVDLHSESGDQRAETLTLETGSPAADYLMRVDRAVYTSGDTMTVTMLAGSGPIFLDVLKDDQSVRSEVIDIRNGQGTLVMDLTPELFGTLRLCAYRFNATGQPVRKTRAIYVRPARELQLTMKTQKAAFRPGEWARLEFSVTDDKGQPTPGAISLALVDEAIFNVRHQLPGIEQSFYTLDRRLLAPIMDKYHWSPENGEASGQRVLLEQAIFARTAGGIARAGALDHRSPHTLTAETYPEKAQIAERERGRGLQTVHLAWILVALWVALALYIILWMNVRTLYLLILHGIVGALLVCGLGAGIVLFAFSTVESRSFTAGKVSDSARQEVMAPAGREPSARIPREVAESGIRVREKFPETLLWRPQLITDDAGRASLDFDLADSITTWRASASVVSADGRLGALQQGVRVFQPFFVDVTLPTELTRGDEIDIPVVVSNYLPKRQTVAISLAKVPWFDLLGADAMTLEMNPREVRSVSFRIRATQVGKHELRVSAKSDDAGDAVKRSVEVIADGHQIGQVVNGSLKEPARLSLEMPADSIEGSSKAIVRLYPSSFSQLVDGLDGIFRLPTGSFEQSSSALFLNVMALKYLRRVNKRSPAVEARALHYIHVGIQRLLTYECPNGGFEWYGKPPGNVTLTAYGLMGLRDLAPVHELDQKLIDRTRRWLLAQQASDGSWDDATRHTEEPVVARRLRTTAYVAWATLDGGSAHEARATRAFLLRHPVESINSTYTLALVCNALLAMNPDDTAVLPYLTMLISSRKGEDTSSVWWPIGNHASTFYGSGNAGNVETTALAVFALIRSNRFPSLVQAALTWLGEQRQVGNWGSTQATVLALKALLQGTTEHPREPRQIEILLDGQRIQTIDVPLDQADVMQQVDLSPRLKPGVQQLALRASRGGAVSYQVEFHYHIPTRVAPAQPDRIEIDVSYDRQELTTGEFLTASARVRTDRESAMLILELPIPPTFRIDRDALDTLIRDGVIDRYEVAPMRIIAYVRRLLPDKPLNFRYRLQSTEPARLALPYPRAWEYYSPEREGRGQPARVIVTRPK